MVISSIVKHLLCDNDSLNSYFKGIPVSFDDVVRSLFLLERQSNKNIPDHYYSLNKQFCMQDIDSLSKILTKGISRISEEFLELRENKVYVKQELQNEWQQLITQISPLLLISSFLASHISLDIKSENEIAEYYRKYIVPNTRYTALPYPYLPQLELYAKVNGGFHDLHMHLNGSTETDTVWQDFLFEPDKAYNELNEGFKDPLTKEQYKQISGLTDPLKFKALLKSASRIRSYFKIILFPHLFDKSALSDITDNKRLIASVNSDAETCKLSDSIYHPFYSLIYKHCDEADFDRSKLLSIESLMYILLFNYQKEHAKEGVALAFHYYLQILGLTNQLLVQQTDQYGFIQFKKITVNELRSRSEMSYKARFFQLQGNNLRNIRYLEGRFSPKMTRVENEKLISNIQTGWEELKKGIMQEWINTGIAKSTPHAELPQLELIVHFIKCPDNKPDDSVRHKALRYKIWNQALVLAYMKKNNSPFMKGVMGIDAASSEFDTPPEVFSPIFRMLRRSGFQHFTYHAGEDFFHIISGLRAIYEAAHFNDLRCGDRIGHATAAGVSAKVWRDNIGQIMLMRQGEYMDDLVFAYHLIIRSSKDQKLYQLKDKIPFMANSIQELSYQIYGKHYSLKTLEDAWLLRKYCPMTMKSLTLPEVEGWEIFNNNNPQQTAEELALFDHHEWSQIRKEISENNHSNESAKLLMMYHQKLYRDTYDKIIKVDVEDIFSLKEIELLQLSILEVLHQKEIVIETLPTSNIRIGHHSSFASYHLWNWIKWENEGCSVPPIVVGTDDTGIFATNIYNEFANIYCFLTKYHNISHSKAMEIITRLERNAHIYKFV